ncbi:hypothetical protein BJX70DRAFT_382790 [Aspergillus crustosus]
MPRPAAKRNRLATRTIANSTNKQGANSSLNTAESRDVSRSPNRDRVGISQLAYSVDPSEVIRQLRSQTPLSKAEGLAIGSSPGTEQAATGSRPLTRARGYSSTLSIAGRKGDMSSRIPATPAFESSILSNFRRRPRQASILHMMQDEDGSSDYDDDDFLGGLSPEDESTTPLNIARGQSLVLRPAVSSPVKSPSLPSGGKSSKRKRIAERVETCETLQSPLNIASSAPGLPTLEPETQEREASVDSARLSKSPTAFSETMAPPYSSPIPGLAHELSTPESARLPLCAAKPQQTRTKQPIGTTFNVPTVALQDRLLPRRRQRRVARQGASGFEVLSDSDSDEYFIAADDDELSYLPMKKRFQTQRKRAIKYKERQSKTRGTDPTITRAYQGTPFPEINGDKENVPSNMSSPLSSALDTDELHSDLDLGQEAQVKDYLSEELRTQALKFAEVDKWQMEFEDVIISNVQETSAFR